MNLLDKIVTSLLLILFLFSAKAQNFEDGFEKYNKKRLGNYTTYWHEMLVCSSLAIDLDFKTSIPGNLATGINYGVGLGYLFKVGLDEKPQNIGLGFKAEYYPNAFYKFNIQLDTKLLAGGFKNWYASFLGGGEFNVTFDLPMAKKEFHTILYMLDIQFNKLELKWGLQMWNDRFNDENIGYFDYTFNSIRVTYKLRSK
jgi:hypothetical protein